MATTQHTGETTCGCSRSAFSNRPSAGWRAWLNPNIISKESRSSISSVDWLKTIHVKTHNSNFNSWTALLAAVLFSGSGSSWSADIPSLKDAYKDHFYVGVAINRTIATGSAVRADNVNRRMEQVAKDISLVRAQFNQISPENDLKWALIHPREGGEGYDFGPADAFVNFGASNNMYLVGHTLVWHGQTPRWVFQGTNMPPEGATNDPAPSVTTNAAGTNRSGSGRFGGDF